MSEIMQNLVILMEPSLDGDNVSVKAGNMILNRFCIDEDAAFELSGIHYLKEASWTMGLGPLVSGGLKAALRRKAKGMEYFYSIGGKFTCQNL